MGRAWPCHAVLVGTADGAGGADLRGDRDTHRTGSALDDAHCHVNIVRVQVRHLQFGDFANLSLGK
mgnify:CR=1 FL=1